MCVSESKCERITENKIYFDVQVLDCSNFKPRAAEQYRGYCSAEYAQN